MEARLPISTGGCLWGTSRAAQGLPGSEVGQEACGRDSRAQAGPSSPRPAGPECVRPRGQMSGGPGDHASTCPCSSVVMRPRGQTAAAPGCHAALWSGDQTGQAAMWPALTQPHRPRVSVPEGGPAGFCVPRCRGAMGSQVTHPSMLGLSCRGKAWWGPPGCADPGPSLPPSLPPLSLGPSGSLCTWHPSVPLVSPLGSCCSGLLAEPLRAPVVIACSVLFASQQPLLFCF